MPRAASHRPAVAAIHPPRSSSRSSAAGPLHLQTQEAPTGAQRRTNRGAATRPSAGCFVGICSRCRQTRCARFPHGSGSIPNEIDAGDEQGQKQKEPWIRQYRQSPSTLEGLGMSVRKKSDQRVNTQNEISGCAIALAKKIVNEQSDGKPKQNEVVCCGCGRLEQCQDSQYSYGWRRCGGDTAFGELDERRKRCKHD